MQKTISVRKATLIVLLASVLVGSVIAAIMYTRTITNEASISAKWEIKVWSCLQTTPVEIVNHIPWGTLDPGSSKTTNQVFQGYCLRIKNHGNAVCFVAWVLDPTTPLPSGVTLEFWITEGNIVQVPENNFGYIQLQPGQLSPTVEWRLIISETALPQTFTFNILLYAADSPGG